MVTLKSQHGLERRNSAYKDYDALRLKRLVKLQGFKDWLLPVLERLNIEYKDVRALFQNASARELFIKTMSEDTKLALTLCYAPGVGFSPWFMPHSSSGWGNLWDCMVPDSLQISQAVEDCEKEKHFHIGKKAILNFENQLLKLKSDYNTVKNYTDSQSQKSKKLIMSQLRKKGATLEVFDSEIQAMEKSLALLRAEDKEARDQR